VHQLRYAAFDIPPDPPPVPFTFTPAAQPPGRITYVLLRCACGQGEDHLKGITVPGHFTTDALLGREQAETARTATVPEPEPAP
jgi:hypothetical protein